LAGLAAPIEMEPLTVDLAAGRMTVPAVKGKVGSVEFEASYRYEPGVAIPHVFTLTVPVLDVAEVQRLFAPTLRRQSAVARTLGFSNGTVPDWLERRRGEGMIRAGKLLWNGKEYPNARARVRWQGPSVEFDSIELGATRGSVKVDLSGGAAKYEVNGNLPRVD
jgi:hypothetical protein